MHEGKARGELITKPQRHDRLKSEKEVLLQHFEQDRATMKAEILSEILRHEDQRNSGKGGSEAVGFDPPPPPPERSCGSSSMSELSLGPPTDDQGTSEK